jgi:hypothetical protein
MSIEDGVDYLPEVLDKTKARDRHPLKNHLIGIFCRK